MLIINSVTQSSPEESNRPFYRIMNPRRSVRGGEVRVCVSLCSCLQPLPNPSPQFLGRGQSLFPASSRQSISLHFPLPPNKRQRYTPSPPAPACWPLSAPSGPPPPINNLAVTSSSHQTVCASILKSCFQKGKGAV